MMNLGYQPAWTTLFFANLSLYWVLEPSEPGLRPWLGHYIVNPTTANKLRRYSLLRVRLHAKLRNPPPYRSDWRVPPGFLYFRVLPSQLSPSQLPPSPTPLPASSSACGHYPSTHEPPRISRLRVGNLCSVQRRKTSLADHKMNKLLASIFQLQNWFSASLVIVVDGCTAAQPMLRTRQSSANAGTRSAATKM